MKTKRKGLYCSYKGCKQYYTIIYLHKPLCEKHWIKVSRDGMEETK